MVLKEWLKRLVSYLPRNWQQALKRLYFARQIRKQRFESREPEFERLGEWIREGDWVIDVGANVGRYTIRLSEVVGPTGRVLAFEPVPESHELLSANVAAAGAKNTTLFNTAASSSCGLAGMEISKFDTGLDDYYSAQISANGAGVQILCIPIDGLRLPATIRLVKIDAEGHELEVLQGMEGVLRRDQPVLIVEDNYPEVARYLEPLGYAMSKIAGSSNLIFEVAAHEESKAASTRS